MPSLPASRSEAPLHIVGLVGLAALMMGAGLALLPAIHLPGGPPQATEGLPSRARPGRSRPAEAAVRPPARKPPSLDTPTGAATAARSGPAAGDGTAVSEPDRTSTSDPEKEITGERSPTRPEAGLSPSSSSTPRTGNGSSGVPVDGTATPAAPDPVPVYYQVRVGRLDSRAAAEQYQTGFRTKTGLESEIVASDTGFSLQVASFRSRQAADRLAAEIRQQSYDVDVTGGPAGRREPAARTDRPENAPPAR